MTSVQLENGEVHEYDQIISTMPISPAGGKTCLRLPPDMLEQSRKLHIQEYHPCLPQGGQARPFFRPVALYPRSIGRALAGLPISGTGFPPSMEIPNHPSSAWNTGVILRIPFGSMDPDQLIDKAKEEIVMARTCPRGRGNGGTCCQLATMLPGLFPRLQGGP